MAWSWGQYVIEVGLPLYIEQKSQVYLNVTIKRYSRGGQSLNVETTPINVPKTGNPVRSQTSFGVKDIAVLQPLEYERDAKGQIIKANTFGEFDKSIVWHINAKARVEVENVSYPQTLLAYEKIDDEQAQPENAIDWQTEILKL